MARFNRNFLYGFGSVLSVYPVARPPVPIEWPTTDRSIAEVLRGDSLKVEQDFRRAFRKIVREARSRGEIRRRGTARPDAARSDEPLQAQAPAC